MKPKATKGAEVGTTTALMMKAQAGDQAAFDRLAEALEARGTTIGQFLSSWSATTVVNKLKDRTSPQNLLARAAVDHDLKATTEDLTDLDDGPIERLIVDRAALGVVDMRLAEREYQYVAGEGGAAAPIEALDRRRERSQRMLLAALKALASVRRMNRPVVQVNIGDGNRNVLKA